jgi:hypothetical protein
MESEEKDWKQSEGRINLVIAAFVCLLVGDGFTFACVWWE